MTEEVKSDDYVNVAVGFYHACALNLHGRVRCWGVTLERTFAIQNYTHLALVEGYNSSYGGGSAPPTYHPDTGELMNRTWTYMRPTGRTGTDYREFNFLPLTMKYGWTP